MDRSEPNSDRHNSHGPSSGQPPVQLELWPERSVALWGPSSAKLEAELTVLRERKRALDEMLPVLERRRHYVESMQHYKRDGGNMRLLRKHLVEVARRIGDPHPPSVLDVRNWAKSLGFVEVPPSWKDRTHLLHPMVRDAMASVIREHRAGRPHTIEDTYALLSDRVERKRMSCCIAGALRMPSFTTFARVIARQDPFPVLRRARSNVDWIDFLIRSRERELRR